MINSSPDLPIPYEKAKLPVDVLHILRIDLPLASLHLINQSINQFMSDYVHAEITYIILISIYYVHYSHELK